MCGTFCDNNPIRCGRIQRIAKVFFVALCFSKFFFLVAFRAVPAPDNFYPHHCSDNDKEENDVPVFRFVFAFYRFAFFSPTLYTSVNDI